MGTNGQFDIDSGNGNGRFLLDEQGRFKICGDCCESCPHPSLIVTLSGVDAGLCTECFSYSVGYAYQYTGLNVDGTYELPFIAGEGTYTTPCVYEIETTRPGLHARDHYEGASGGVCSSFVDAQATDQLRIQVRLVGSEVTGIFAGAMDLPTNPKNVTILSYARSSLGHSGPYYLGDTIQNHADCNHAGTVKPISGGGTAVVEVA